MNKREKKLLSIFVRFLKDNHVYNKFIERYFETYSITWREGFFNREVHLFKDVVANAFPWAYHENKEGDFWINIDLKWKSLINKTKGVTFETKFDLENVIKIHKIMDR